MSVKRNRQIHTLEEFKLVDPSKRETYPPAFDLVLLLTEHEKIIPGWHISSDLWGGYKYKEGMKVKGWKRKYGMY